ncbi:MAG: hypothetical protein RL187_364, partial [Actinomycetota bacterium]
MSEVEESPALPPAVLQSPVVLVDTLSRFHRALDEKVGLQGV